MDNFWEIVLKVSIVFGLLDISLFSIVGKSYRILKNRIDIQQRIIVSRKRTSKLWYWVVFGFISFYISFFIYSSIIYFLVPAYQNVFLLDLLLPSLLVLPVALSGMFIGYTFVRWLLN